MPGVWGGPPALKVPQGRGGIEGVDQGHFSILIEKAKGYHI